jgi:hypothetical protein
VGHAALAPGFKVAAESMLEQRMVQPVLIARNHCPVAWHVAKGPVPVAGATHVPLHDPPLACPGHAGQTVLAPGDRFTVEGQATEQLAAVVTLH